MILIFQTLAIIVLCSCATLGLFTWIFLMAREALDEIVGEHKQVYEPWPRLWKK